MWVDELTKAIAAQLNPRNDAVNRDHLGFLGHYCWPRGFGAPGSIRLEVVFVSNHTQNDILIVEAGTSWRQARKWKVEEKDFVRDRSAFEQLCMDGIEKAIHNCDD